MGDTWLDVPCVCAVPSCFHTRIRSSVVWSRKRLSSDQWILWHVLKLQQHCAKDHAKRNRWYRCDNLGRLIILLDLIVLLISKCHSLFLFTDVYLVTIVWFRIGMVANGIRPTKRCSALFSHYYVACDLMYLEKYFVVWVFFLTRRMTSCFVFFTPPIFAFVPCSHKMDKFVKTPGLSTQIWSVEILNIG